MDKYSTPSSNQHAVGIVKRPSAAVKKDRPKNNPARHAGEAGGQDAKYDPLLLHRFGPDILKEGFTVQPVIFEQYRKELRISIYEMRFIVYLWNRWKPKKHVSMPVEAIAGALHVSEHSIRRYTHALKEKGLLDVSFQPGRGKHNQYDLRPFLEKLRALDSQRRGEL